VFNFFKKGEGANSLSGPKDIPNEVGSYLVMKLKQNPDWVWVLKAVMKPEGEKKKSLVRVYDPKMVDSKGIKITNYHTFDEHPELISFSGWFRKATGTHPAEVEIPPKTT
jgi:hypothetical protein